MNQLEEDIMKKRLERLEYATKLMKEKEWLGFFTDDVKYKMLCWLLGFNKDLDTEIYFLGQKK